MVSLEHESAVRRLDAGRVEQERLRERHNAAIGTSAELRSYRRLGAACDQVAARETWLRWVDDEGYRGLNAGPFELLAEQTPAGRDQTLSERDRETSADGLAVSAGDPPVVVGGSLTHEAALRALQRRGNGRWGRV